MKLLEGGTAQRQSNAAPRARSTASERRARLKLLKGGAAQSQSNAALVHQPSSRRHCPEAVERRPTASTVIKGGTALREKG